MRLLLRGHFACLHQVDRSDDEKDKRYHDTARRFFVAVGRHRAVKGVRKATTLRFFTRLGLGEAACLKASERLQRLFQGPMLVFAPNFVGSEGAH
jgi:hypothetical protein